MKARYAFGFIAGLIAFMSGVAMVFAILLKTGLMETYFVHVTLALVFMFIGGFVIGTVVERNQQDLEKQSRLVLGGYQPDGGESMVNPPKVK